MHANVKESTHVWKIEKRDDVPVWVPVGRYIGDGKYVTDWKKFLNAEAAVDAWSGCGAPVTINVDPNNPDVEPPDNWREIITE